MVTRLPRSFQARTLFVLAGMACCAFPASAQDSVTNSTGVGGDAIDAYDTTRQTVRYAVDLVPLTTSWGNTWGIAPLVKTSRDADALFNTLALGAAAVSPDVRQNVALAGAEQQFRRWSNVGFGVGPGNLTPVTTTVSSLDYRFGVSLGDVNADASNAIGAMVGFNDAMPTRLYVRRTIGAHSRSFAFLSDNGTLYPTAIDADGHLHLRADDFNGVGANQLLGENIVTVDLLSRSGGLNGLTKSGSTNIAGDSSATTYAVNNGSGTTLNPPTALPASIAATDLPLVLDTNGDYRAGSGATTTAHLAADVIGHRGNPTFSTATGLGGIGTVASLARTTDTPSLTAGVNVFGVDAAGAPQGVATGTLPIPMPGFPTLNASGTAVFDQYNNQTLFRGPAGHAAIGTDFVTGDLLVAATASDPNAGDFIAVARIGSPLTWEVAAAVGSPVLNGPGGGQIGVLGDAPFGAISAPAMDLYGNVYFVGLFDDAINPVVPALFKAVDTTSGYQLELILKQGQQFTGGNSNVLYTVENIALADTDSIATAGFSAASVLQPTDGAAPGAARPDTVGAVIVGATISYARVGGPEKYDVALILKPERPVGSSCAGDFDGDGDVDLSDFGTFGAAFGSVVGDPNYNPDADFDNDGDVDLSDFGTFGSEFGRTDCL